MVRLLLQQTVPNQRHVFDTSPFFQSLGTEQDVSDANTYTTFSSRICCTEDVFTVLLTVSSVSVAVNGTRIDVVVALQVYVKILPDAPPLETRREHFIEGCRNGHAAINFRQYDFNPSIINAECDFDRSPGQVHIQTQFVLNGVCVRWIGYIDIETLEGQAKLEFDEEQAEVTPTTVAVSADGQ